MYYLSCINICKKVMKQTHQQNIYLFCLYVFSLFADFANVFAYCVVFWFDFAHFEKVQ